MPLFNEQVKGAFSGCWNAFWLRLIQSPGTTIGGMLLSLGAILSFTEAPVLVHYAKVITGLGGCILGLNAVSHGFQQKQADTMFLTNPNLTQPPQAVPAFNPATVPQSPPTVTTTSPAIATTPKP